LIWTLIVALIRISEKNKKRIVEPHLVACGSGSRKKKWSGTRIPTWALSANMLYIVDKKKHTGIYFSIPTPAPETLWYSAAPAPQSWEAEERQQKKTEQRRKVRTQTLRQNVSSRKTLKRIGPI
jgi:hypothetical protein